MTMCDMPSATATTTVYGHQQQQASILKRPSSIKGGKVSKLRGELSQSRRDSDEFSPVASPRGACHSRPGWKTSSANGPRRASFDGAANSSSALSSPRTLLGFRPDLDQAQQQKRMSLHHAARKAHYRAHDHIYCTMDWCDTAAGFKWRLKVMTVEAATQERMRREKGKSTSPTALAETGEAKKEKDGSAPTLIPAASICKDIDAYFLPGHVNRVGGLQKGFENVRRQLMSMDLYRDDRRPLPAAATTRSEQL